MDNGFIERRRSPRIPMGAGARVVRPMSMAVRLLDLSADGVLLACPDPIAPGSTSRVTARLGTRPFDAEVNVRHVSSVWDQRIGGYRVGGRFLALAPQVKSAVESLLSGSDHSD
jgi:hypothetical protein